MNATSAAEKSGLALKQANAESVSGCFSAQPITVQLCWSRECLGLVRMVLGAFLGGVPWRYQCIPTLTSLNEIVSTEADDERRDQ
jgi:hypothetical protein